MPMIAQNMWWAIETHENADNARTYHTRLRLIDDMNICRAQSNMQQAMTRDGTILDLPATLRLVLDIRGVTEAIIQPYSITVLKSPVVSWPEIEAEVQPLLYGVKQAVTLPAYADGQPDVGPLTASAE